jgi:multimeric flavodoxin WrbA
MLVLAINGSPRKDGNTARVLKATLDEAAALGADTAFIQVSDALEAVKVPYCIHCSIQCKGVCYEGTALVGMFDLLRRADGVLLGSPVYFGTVSAQLKSFWDKTRRLRREFALLNVVGGAVAVGGARFGGQETTVRALHDMMLVQGMTLVGDGHMSGDAGHQGVCTQQFVGNDQPANERARQVDKRMRLLVHRVVEVARATAELREAGRAAAQR